MRTLLSLIALIALAVLAPPWLRTIVLTGMVACLGLTGCCLLLLALFPQPAEAARERLVRKPLRCCLLGWLLVLAQVLVLTLLPEGIRGPIALGFVLCDGALLWVGMAALSVALADRLRFGENLWRRTLCSQGVVCSCLGLPVIGWAVALQAGLAALGSTLWR